MATVTTKLPIEIVRDMVVAVQGSAAGIIDATIGSITRAYSEAVAQVAFWLQALYVQLLLTTRLATCSGAAVDTFVGQYDLLRLAATPASGSVTFGRFSTTSLATVPVGVTIETADGSQVYSVDLDTTNAAYNAVTNSYDMADGVGSVTVHVTARIAGTAANAAGGAINTITSVVPSVSAVTNALAFTNGQDAESDAALKKRFVDYIASLSKATKSAIQFAIESIQENIFFSLVENADFDGTYDPGYFYVVADDGSGTPGAPFLASVSAAIEPVRAIGTRFNVFAPTLQAANVSMTITTAAGYNHSTIAAAVQAAIDAYIGALQLGAGLTYTRLVQIAYDTSPGVTNVASVLLNAGTADIAGSPKKVIRAGTVVIT